ncbi:MAG: trypsin-like peptidase domain-containing protein [Firmicutes bacterium]|nr:trypsin-like peptidase domain-containing protein [Bacillota bacterium]
MSNNKLKTAIFLFIMSVFLIPAGFKPVWAGYPGVEKTVVDAVDRVEPAVVNIKTVWSSYGSSRESTGSGVIITRSGWVITNAHVIRNAAKIYVFLSDGRKFQAVSWKADPREDIAVVKIDGSNLPVASIGNSSGLKKGQLAIAIGNPWKFNSTVTVGCISGMGRNLSAGTSEFSISYRDLIQTDAAINPGNSGGALANSSGQVIGINTLVYTGRSGELAQGLSFAIPINNAMKVANRLMTGKGGTQMKPWLGVQVSEITPDMSLGVKHGVVIINFPPDSPARDAGLRPGDVIISINQVPVTKVEDVQKAIFNYKPGDTVQIVVSRQGRKLRAIVKLEGMRQ